MTEERLSDSAITIINDMHGTRLDYTSEYLPLIDAAYKLGEFEDGVEDGSVYLKKEEEFSEKTQRIISELQSMMGEKMYYGEMVGAPAPYCHDGPMVYENPEDYSLEKAVDILQRMLDRDWELPEKTADEMFRELGYHCMEPVPQGIFMYQMPFGPKIEIYTETGEVSKEGENYNEVTWTTPEILACAQLIKEMQNGSD